MNKSGFQIIIAIVILLIPGQYLFAEDSGVSKRIEGVADFLIEIANENAICMFEEKINKNPLIKEYFPNTSKMLETFDLKILMLNSTLWKNNIEKDLNAFAEVLKSKLKQEGTSLISENNYKELKKFNDKIKNIIDKPEIYNQFSEFFRLTEENLKAIQLDALADTDSLKLANMFLDDIINKMPEDTIIQGVDKSTEVISIMKLLRKNFIYMRDSFEHVNYVLNKELTYTERTTHIFIVIESLDAFDKIIDRQSSNYKKFKNYALFFTQLSDAKSQSEAKVVLKTFALPPGSYKSKRKDEMRFSLSSYLGLAGGIETMNSDNYFYYGITAPIGLELSWGIKQKSSISILGIIFDLGAVVNSQIYNTTESFDFKDIFAPGLAFIYGFPDMPLSMGLGYSKVNGLRNNASNEQRVILFMAFDMPLFVLY